MEPKKRKQKKPEMTSLLAQLNKLSEETPVEARKRPFLSLLFEAQQASALDLETIFAIGREGLSELIKIDERFRPFEDSLFNNSSKTVERELQTREVNKRIDNSVNAFLQLLSPYFLLRSAHKALEYLIRRYR
jgi:U3 small nucleolar RNA-associated protein 10